MTTLCSPVWHIAGLVLACFGLVHFTSGLILELYALKRDRHALQFAGGAIVAVGGKQLTVYSFSHPCLCILFIFNYWNSLKWQQRWSANGQQLQLQDPSQAEYWSRVLGYHGCRRWSSVLGYHGCSWWSSDLVIIAVVGASVLTERASVGNIM